MNNVKDALARLLAQEDLAVEHSGVETAQFNVETRVLTLPIWQTNPVIVDSLIAHEVGHALYTPNDWSFEGKIPLQYVNIIEDIRVEKLMKRRYAGLAKTFYNGYNLLNQEDFFSIEGEDISKYNLADRINIFYKIGHFVDVSFSESEKEFIDLCNALETFSDTLVLAEQLYLHCKENAKENANEEINTNQNTNNSTAGGGSDFSDQPSDQQSGDDIDGDGDELGDSAPQSSGQSEQTESGGDGPADDTEIKTAESLSESLKDIAKKIQSEFEENVYLEVPKIDWSKFVIPNNEVHDHCQGYWDTNGYSTEDFFFVDKEYTQFRKSSNQEVNYLVKEFEMKKSASSFARATTSRTGVLDCTKLHTYKFNEDLFKKVTNLQEGKNHALIFNLDWSGSMSDVMVPTVKQLIALVSFCRKVGIAYRVYAFSDSWGTVSDYWRENYNQESNKIWIHPDFSFLELLSSDSNNSTHERQCRNLYRVVKTFERGYYNKYPCPRKMGLGGTPLNECVLSMLQLAPDLKVKSKCEKVHVINLTDGEGSPLHRSSKVHYKSGESHIHRRPITGNCHLRDRKVGMTYKFNFNSWDQTNLYVQNFRDRFPEFEMISIRLLSGRDWKRYMYGHVPNDQQNRADQEWKKNKSYINPHTPYTMSYLLRSEDLESSTEFEVAEDASKAQIKNAFKKSLSGKKANKKILSSFISQIA